MANASASADATPNTVSDWRAAASNTPMLAADDGIAWAYVAATVARPPAGHGSDRTNARATMAVEAASTIHEANDQASTTAAARAERSGSNASDAVSSIARRRRSAPTRSINRETQRLRRAERTTAARPAAIASTQALMTTSDVRVTPAGTAGAIASIRIATVTRSNTRSRR